MSISQLTQGGHERANTAARTARERAGAAAEKEREIGQRQRRAEQDRMPSYEAFERAQQLQAKVHAGGASRIATALSDATSAPVEGDPLEPGPAGSSTKAIVSGSRSAGVSDSNADLVTGGTGPAAAAVATGDAAVIADAAMTAAVTPAGAPNGGAARTGDAAMSPAEEEPAPATTTTVGKLVGERQLSTSTEGGYAQHYGSFPVLVAGHLVELDLYTLGQRTAGAPDNVRRLFLALNSTSLGPVEVTAELSEGRLNVLVEGAATGVAEGAGTAGSDALNEHVRAVGELASRLGWKFESIGPAAVSPGAAAGLDGLDRLL